MRGIEVCVVAALSLGGCGNPYREVVKPSDITLDNALSQVILAIAHVKEIEKKTDTQLGVIVDQVDLDLQLAVSGSQQDKLSIAVTAPTGAPVGGSLGASDEETRSANRGSTIHLTLKSLTTAPINYVGCYYILRTEYSEAATKGCVSAKPTDSSTDKSSNAASKDKSKITPKKTTEIDSDTVERGAINKMSRELAQRDTGFVIIDAVKQ